MPAPLLETERLRMRPHRTEDFEPLADIFATPRSKYIGGPLSRREVWRNFAADVGQWELLGFGAWAVELRDGGTFVGQVGLNRPQHFPEREIGWILCQAHEGHGYALEAALRARAFAYDDLGWTTAVSYIDPANRRSRRLAERMGAAPDPGAATPNDEPSLVYRHPPPDRLT